MTTNSGAYRTFADPRIARIERGIAQFGAHDPLDWRDDAFTARAALADLHAWQEIVARHARNGDGAFYCRCGDTFPCPDRQAADDALDRLDALWGTDD